MVDGDDHYIAALAEPRAVIERAGAGAVRVRTAVYVEHDRALRAIAKSGRPDVQEQAVFADGLGFLATLRRGGAVLRGIERLLPGLRCDGGHEAPKRGVGPITDALERMDAVVDGATDLAVNGGGKG